MGAFRPTRARRAKKKGDTRMIPAISATNPGTSQTTPPPFPAAPERENMMNPMTSAITPGTNERWIWRGGAGRPARALTTGTRVMARAGWPAAKKVATTASTIATTITVHGRANIGDEVMRALLVVRAVGEPGHQTQPETHHGAHGADDDAVGLQHEPDVAVRRPHGFEHPDGAQAALRQHGESADRHQCDQQHADGRQRQHDGVGIDRVVGERARRRDVGPDAARVHARCVEEDVDRRSGASPAREEQARTRRAGSGGSARCRPPSCRLGRPGVAHPQVELGRQPRSEGDLVRPGRVVPREQLEHRPAVGAVRVLGAKFVGLGAAGDMECLVLDHLDRAEAVLERGDLGVHRLQIESVGLLRVRA